MAHEQEDFGFALTVALVVGRHRTRGQRVIDAVGAQSVDRPIEMIVIDLAPAGTPPLCAPKAIETRYFERPGDSDLPRARADAARMARSPVVAYIEDHCYPAPGWAQALLDSHREDWVAVGYAFTNANPVNYISRGSMVANYGPFMHPARGGPASFLPGNNVSYKRETLHGFGAGLDRLLSPDFCLQQVLRMRGEPMCIEPKALAAHENWPHLGGVLRATHDFCRYLGARRAEALQWSPLRRWFYGVMTPVSSPVVSCYRLLSSVRERPELTGAIIEALPIDLLTHLWAGIGEAQGYLFGEGDSEEKLFATEIGLARSIVD